jgi:hypothetical protein
MFSINAELKQHSGGFVMNHRDFNTVKKGIL